MANTYVPILYPSVCYPSSSTEPPRIVQSAAELATLNAAPVSTLPGAAAPVQFGLTVSAVPKTPLAPVAGGVPLNFSAHPSVTAAQLSAFAATFAKH